MVTEEQDNIRNIKKVNNEHAPNHWSILFSSRYLHNKMYCQWGIYINHEQLMKYEDSYKKFFNVCL
jgi:hypothetical protein